MAATVRVDELEVDTGAKYAQVDDQKKTVNVSVDPLRRASLVSSVVNFVNTCVGAGILGLPLAFAKAGILWATVLVAAVCAATYFSNYVLFAMSHKYHTTTYPDICALAFGRPGFAVGQVVILLFHFCVLWAYVVLIGDFITSLLAPVCTSCVLLDRAFDCAIIMVFILMPLSYMRSLRALRWSSYAALIGVSLLIVTIFVRLILPFEGRRVPGSPQFFVASPQVFVAFPIIALAFCAQSNVPALCRELVSPTERRLTALVSASLVVCLLAYYLTGILGYALFPSGLTGDFVLSFDARDPLAIVARIAVFVTILFSYPILFHPLRNALYELIFLKAAPNAESTPTPRFPALYRNGTDHIPRLILLVPLCAVTYTLGVCLVDLDYLFELTGATVGVALAYLLPALCWFKVRLTLEGARACSKDNIAAVLVATLGVVMAVISLVISILNLASSVH